MIKIFSMIKTGCFFLYIFLILISSCVKKGIDIKDARSVWSDVNLLQKKVCNDLPETESRRCFFIDKEVLNFKDNPVNDVSFVRRNFDKIDKESSEEYKLFSSNFNFYYFDSIVIRNNKYLIILEKRMLPSDISVYSKLSILSGNVSVNSFLLAKHEEHPLYKEIVSSILLPNNIIIRRTINSIYSDILTDFWVCSKTTYVQKTKTEFYSFDVKAGNFKVFKENTSEKEFSRYKWF